ncbi:hypothetical protein [Candidatus Nitrosotenuis aquarius]|uniref:hypothetical protein n=1 Tax=Candidatus Nitrosotenuis aquarius TaxID=1846278 RepID=UPI0013C2DCEC|nr:hypothetical protein [Candidatus Nitrosotenuis aquarius]
MADSYAKLIVKISSANFVYRVFAILGLVFVLGFTVSVFAEEPRLATFHETATILVDQRMSNNVTASVSLQTTSLHEFQIPPALDQKIRNNTDIVAVVITNENQCVLGVQDDICVLVNVKRQEGEGGIQAAQQKARQTGDAIIDDINEFFGLDTEFHSTFIHYDDKANRALETQGQVSGRGVVSAVYTASFQNTDFMFNRVSSALIPSQIRSMGGFYEIAQTLSKDDSSRMTFTILPRGPISVMQLKVSENYPGLAQSITAVEPLKYLKVNEIKKSDYYKVGFFPLNSIVQVVILPQDESAQAAAGSMIGATVKNNQTVPADLETSGWFFNSNSGKKIEAMYLFGKEFSADSSDLKITFGKESLSIPVSVGLQEIVILVGIGAAAAGAVVYYLKGIRSK